MDNNQNQDGLDGLPLESWLNQQHLSSVHPGLSTQIYNHPMSAQSIHDFLSPRTLQTFSAEPIPHISQPSQALSSSAVQQYSLSSSAHLHQPEHLPTSHERSAWSHLLSLDPSVTALGSQMSETQGSLRHCLTQDTPRVQNTGPEPLLMLKGNTKLTSFDNRSLPKMRFSLASGSTASIPLDNYKHMSVINSQEFTKLMNLSKVTNASKPSTPKTLAISNDVPSLESSGSYSPVSPPATDHDEPSMSISSQNSGREADLLLRESHEDTPATFPMFLSSDQTDMFYLSEKSDPFSADFNMQDSYSAPTQPVTASDMLDSPSDVPLDMTTAFGSKADKGSGSKESSHFGGLITFSSDSVIRNTSSNIHTLPTKDQAHPKESFNEINSTASLTERNESHFALPVTSDEKITKLIKSTPKKSNFYGRDASLFSFMSPSSYSSDKQVSMPHLQESVQTDMENKNLLNSANEVPSDAAIIQQQDKINNTAENSTIVSPGINLFTEVLAGSITPSADTFARVPTSEVNLPLLGCTISQSHNSDTLIHSFGVSETNFKQNYIEPESNENHNSTNGILKCALSSNGNIMTSSAKPTDEGNCLENINHLNENFDTASLNDNFLTTHITRKIKTPKRKKRKATGFQTKQRKNPVRKQLQVQLDVFGDSSVNIESNNNSTDMDVLSTEVSEMQNSELVSLSDESVPGKRKTRQLSKTKASSSDLVPRRSSSRKSKDNAMRLIELQADANYSGISQPADVAEKKTRKRKMLRPSLALGDDASELSGESTEEYRSDDNDGDYVLDEDETETLYNEDLIEEQTDKKVVKERKLGGLKISIKLSGNSSAEIVSGISDSHVKKRKKSVKKKGVKTKSRDKLKTSKHRDDAFVDHDFDNSNTTMENVQEPPNLEASDKVEEDGNSEDVKDRHMSLMEKYFSSANSATVARQINKKTESGKEKGARKKGKDVATSKLSKKLALKSGTIGAKKQSELGEPAKQKASVKFLLESTNKKDKVEQGMEQEDAETEVLKFVCGYCPQRYHNKQELLAHMEAHMVEMERKTDTEAGPAVDASMKTPADTISLALNKGPKTNRIGSSSLNSGKSTTESGTERGKLKATVDQEKDSDCKNTLKQKFKCGECEQVFDSKPSLLDHVRIHTADKPFECDICHKCFTERNFLSAHRKTHGQDKLLRCLMCSKAFVHKADLTLHMQSHPKRSNIKSTDIHTLSFKKSFKKDVHEKHNEESSFSSKKPKSFASALTGELEVSGKSNDFSPVLILTRGDGPSVEVKNSSSTGNKTALNEPKVTLKPATSPLHKQNVVKSNSCVKKPAENPVVSSSMKGDSKMDSKISGHVDNSCQVKTSDEPSSDVCTCKECPECVTRFLQSFE